MQRQRVHLVPPCHCIPRHRCVANSQDSSSLFLSSIHHAGHSNVDEEFICTEFLPKLRSNPKIGPRAMVNHLKEEYGVEITHIKAWRARERAVKVINGSHEEAYNSLPKYCQEIQRLNPGSTVQLDIEPMTNQFKHLFICFAAIVMGFAYCRPMLGLDGTHLKHKFQGTIICQSNNVSNCRNSSRCHCYRCQWFIVPSCPCSCRCQK